MSNRVRPSQAVIMIHLDNLDQWEPLIQLDSPVLPPLHNAIRRWTKRQKWMQASCACADEKHCRFYCGCSHLANHSVSRSHTKLDTIHCSPAAKDGSSKWPLHWTKPSLCLQPGYFVFLPCIPSLLF